MCIIVSRAEVSNDVTDCSRKLHAKIQMDVSGWWNRDRYITCEYLLCVYFEESAGLNATCVCSEKGGSFSVRRKIDCGGREGREVVNYKGLSFTVHENKGSYRRV